MSSYGATAVWGPIVQVRPEVLVPVDGTRRSAARLTRRGRLVRFVAVGAVVAVCAVVGVDRLTEAPALAGTEVSAASVATTRAVVQQGDSLWSIARRTAPGQDPRDVVYRIRELNGLRSNLIHPGEVLLVPSMS